MRACVMVGQLPAAEADPVGAGGWLLTLGLLVLP